MAVTEPETVQKYYDVQNFKRNMDEKKSLDHLLKNHEDSSDVIIKSLNSLFLSNLNKLELTGLGLKELPDKIVTLDKIFEINLSNNELSRLPKAFNNLKTISKLNLSYNKFSEPPDCLYFGMNFLKHIDLSHNELIQFYSAPLSLPFLVSLNLSYNYLDSPPLWLLQDVLCSLEDLDLSYNPCFCSKLSSEFLQIATNRVTASVRRLSLLNTQFSGTNFKFLLSFISLSSLNISNGPRRFKAKEGWNSFSDLNEEVITKIPLEELVTVDCGIPSLPDTIGQMIHLKVLNISENKLLWLPESFSQLPILEIFQASRCGLVVLPSSIGNMTSLRQLWLSNNDISSLPESAQKLTALEILDLYNNSFSSVPDVSGLSSLKGLDIGLNYFKLQDCYILKNETKYEFLRDYLRSSWRKDDRINRAKESLPDHECYEEDEVSHCSSLSSLSEIQDFNQNEGFDNFEHEEQWDLENDYTEYFDPDDFISLQRSPSEDSVVKLRRSLSDKEHYFCPYQEVSNFSSFKSSNLDTHIEEGQFDDA